MASRGPRASDLGYVFLGGAFGATARVALVTWFPVDAGAYPWATFLENVVGAFLLALVLTLLLRRGLAARRTQLTVGTGALGAFTTTSTLAVEVERLLQGGALLIGVGYAVASLAAGLAAAFAGSLLARHATREDAEVSR